MKGFPRVHQLGFVVRDMERAMQEYGNIYRIKQWYRPVNEPQGKLYYRGQRFSDSGYDMRIGYCGSTEIELITTAAKENIYTTFLEECGEGLHHISFFVSDIDRYVDTYKNLGFEVIQNGTINGKSMCTRFAYLAIPGEHSTRIVEFSEVKAGKLALSRNRFNIRLGVLTGNLTKA